MDTQPALERLLPVIRCDTEGRGVFRPSLYNIAIYRDEVVLFRKRKAYLPPEAAYHPGGVEALLTSRAVRGRPVRVSLSEVTDVTYDHRAVRLASRARGSLKARGKRYG